MKYPKPIMKTNELKKMGFTRTFLDSIAHMRGQEVAFRVGREYLWDTEKLEEARKKTLAR